MHASLISQPHAARLPSALSTERHARWPPVQTLQAWTKAGQLPITVEWTQGQGASALELLWKPPGGRKWEQLPVTVPKAP